MCETERPLKMLKSKPSDFFSKIYYLFHFFVCVWSRSGEKSGQENYFILFCLNIEKT